MDIVPKEQTIQNAESTPTLDFTKYLSGLGDSLIEALGPSSAEASPLSKAVMKAPTAAIEKTTFQKSAKAMADKARLKSFHHIPAISEHGLMAGDELAWKRLNYQAEHLPEFTRSGGVGFGKEMSAKEHQKITSKTAKTYAKKKEIEKAPQLQKSEQESLMDLLKNPEEIATQEQRAEIMNRFATTGPRKSLKENVEPQLTQLLKELPEGTQAYLFGSYVNPAVATKSGKAAFKGAHAGDLDVAVFHKSTPDWLSSGGSLDAPVSKLHVQEYPPRQKMISRGRDPIALLEQMAEKKYGIGGYKRILQLAAAGVPLSMIMNELTKTEKPQE